ncbi:MULTISPECIES: fic family toxin-antitoxin system, toxin component [unclassified Streptomyces]|uniref:fic family toxin-antitoxin system, toxin component n=1 Tax=unclassified Streptomyces TaxID=2593676 RepID=UPI0024801835|nr:fic family toxin-antitoxin system, toxin component [Streptomyces sp. HYC2]
MILHVDRAWLLDVAHQHLRQDPDVTDYGSLAAAVARHADQVLDVPVYAEPHHRAAALMQLLIQVPALESRNELFASVVAAAYLTASGLTVTAEPKDAVALASRVRDGLSVRDLAHEIRRGWIAG